jgi:TRAP-type C4-dicarboxylate transport system substrate-binding protein
MKKTLAIVMCAIMTLVIFAGCSGEDTAETPSATDSFTPELTETPTPSPTEPPVVLCMASAGTLSGTNKGDALKKGFDDLKSSSSGALTIDFYEGGEKGTDAEIIAAVKSGDVSIYIGDASMVKEVIPQLAVLDLPMMFPNISACNIMLGGSFIEMMQPYFNEAGLQLIGAYSTSFRQLTVKTEDRIVAAKDLKGLRINTSENEYSQLFWKTLGCNVFTLTDSQMFTATKQKLINGQESTYAAINSLKLYDSQSDLIKTRHGQPVELFVMNKEQYDALTDSKKEWLEEFITKVGQDEVTAVAEDEEEQETLFKKKLLKPYEPSEEILNALKSAVTPVVELMKQSVDPELVDNYIAACKQAEIDAENAAAAPTEDPSASDAAASKQP